MAQAKTLGDELVEIEEPARPDPSKPRCASCAYFAPPTTNRAQVEKMGGMWRGDCQLHPVPVPKRPDDACGQHPDMAAKLLTEAFAPLIDRFAAVMNMAIALPPRPPIVTEAPPAEKGGRK